MNKLPPEQADLKRSLSLPLVVFYGVGTILGAGIYVLVGKVAGLAGMHTPAAFLMALILAAFSAFSYVELSGRFPVSAGEAMYVQQGINCRRLSLLAGIAIILAGAISVATLLHGFAGYLRVFFEFNTQIVIILTVLVLGLIVAWGINESVVLATLMTVVEIGGLLLILWVARENFSSLGERLPDMLPDPAFSAWDGILLGSMIAFYAFIGFEDIVNIAEEIRNPHRNLPLAIIWSLLITAVLYLLVSVLVILTLPTERLAESEAPLAEIYTHVTGHSPAVITVISLISVINGALVQVIKASRIIYGMSRQHWLPAWLGKVHTRTQTPLFATFTVTLIVLLFALTLQIINLARLTSFITLVVFALVNFSLVRIKRHNPASGGIITIPFWVPITGFLCSSSFVLYQIWLYLQTSGQ